MIYVWVGSLASDVTSAISQGGTAAAPPAGEACVGMLIMLYLAGYVPAALASTP